MKTLEQLQTERQQLEREALALYAKHLRSLLEDEEDKDRMFALLAAIRGIEDYLS